MGEDWERIGAIGEIMLVPFARPRVGEATPKEYRARMMEDPKFYELRNEALDFLYHPHARADT